jgi:hypothetical protein
MHLQVSRRGCLRFRTVLLLKCTSGDHSSLSMLEMQQRS